MLRVSVRLTLLLLCCQCSWCSAATWFVSPQGDDSSQGTKARPFRTILRALKESRKSMAKVGPKVISLGDGEYFDSSIVLGPEDSGLEISAAKGAKPLLVGGCKLGTLRPEGEFWSAELPREVSADIRLLVVNDHFASRARFPASGTLEHLSRFDVPWMGTYGGGWKRKPTHEELATLKVDPQTLGPAFEAQNAELTIYHEWDESLVALRSYDAATGEMKFTAESGHPPGAFGNKSFVIWNTRDGMTRPGQWYVDRARRKVFYWPLPGETPERANVLVPTTEVVVRIDGREGAPVRNVTLKGLGLTVNNTPLKSGGFGAYAFDGAITATHVKGLRLIGLSIFNVAGQGLKIRKAEDSEVSGCSIRSTGAGGMLAGDARVSLRGNRVEEVGRIYPSAIAISCSGTSNAVIGNFVSRTPYVGITCDGTGARIERNRIERVMQELHDGAGIYLGGIGHAIRGNFCSAIGNSVTDRRHAYYMDEHVRDCLLQGNLALECPSPLHNHIATNNVIENNIFINHGDLRLAFFRCADHQLKNNLLWATGKIELYRPEAVSFWTNNFFQTGANQVVGYPVDRYSPGAPSPLICPGVTILTNLSLKIEETGKVTLPKNSLPAKAGIRSLDVSGAGK